MQRSVWKTVLGAIVVVSIVAPSPALFACSMCRCGDPTFTALGTQIFAAGAWRASLDLERRQKSAAEADMPPAIQRTTAASAANTRSVEQRATLALAYSFGERVTLVGRLPFSRHQQTTNERRDEVSGRGDPELLAVARLWSASPRAGLGRSGWISAVIGVKAPWGENNRRDFGQRLDEHVQPGTGSTDLSAGVSAVRLLDQRSTLYGSLIARRSGDNRFGYRYGNAWFGNVGLEHKFSARWDAVIELNLRDAARDRIDRNGALDDNSGGRVAYLSPRLLIDLGHRVIARVGAQFPVYERLDGVQNEKTTLSAGVTASF